MLDTKLTPIAPLAALPTAAMRLDYRSRVIDWNPACQRLLGFKKSDILNTKTHPWLQNPKADAELFAPPLQNKSWQASVLCQHKNGKTLYCHMQLSYLADEKQILIILHDTSALQRKVLELKEQYDALKQKAKEQTSMLHVANSLLEHNINERDHIDKVLRDNEQRFRLLAENSSDIISQQTPDKKFIYVSPSCFSLLGYTPKDIIGKNSTDFIHTGDLKKLKDTKALEPDENDRTTLTYRVRKKDGNYIWFETTARYIRDPQSNKVIEIHASSRDITARIAEEKSRHRSQKLAQVFRLNTMEEMASGMAHEINQPLSAVVNYTQGCIRHLENDGSEKNKKLIEVMEKASLQAKRAGEVIHRLKNFFAKGKLFISPEKSGRLIRESINLIKDEITKADVSIKYKLGKNLPLVNVDKIQIQQVILNLVHNAIEAMVETPKDQRKITIKTTLTDDEKKIIYTFQDTGPGFTEEVADKIFQAFFTTKPKGTGMGLPISRSIIEAHGGKFSILTSNGKTDGGVCFTLPVTDKKRR